MCFKPWRATYRARSLPELPAAAAGFHQPVEFVQSINEPTLLHEVQTGKCHWTHILVFFFNITHYLYELHLPANALSKFWNIRMQERAAPLCTLQYLPKTLCLPPNMCGLCSVPNTFDPDAAFHWFVNSDQRSKAGLVLASLIINSSIQALYSTFPYQPWCGTRLNSLLHCLLPSSVFMENITFIWHHRLFTQLYFF